MNNETVLYRAPIIIKTEEYQLAALEQSPILLTGNQSIIVGPPPPDCARLVTITDLCPLESPFLNGPVDIIVAAPTQSGKTQYIIEDAWNTLKNPKLLPIIIASELTSVLDQFITRCHQQLGFSPLQIEPNSDFSTLFRTIYATILHPRRLEKVRDLIRIGVSRGFGFVLFYDEADLAVKESICQVEIFQRELAYSFGKYVQNVYITATPFALYNSEFRNARPALIKLLNPKKEGFVYRDYTSMIHQVTDSFSALAETPKCNPLNYSEFAWYLFHELVQPSSQDQPNLCLVKAFHDNSRKTELAKGLSCLIQVFNFLVYTGEGATLYRASYTIHIWPSGMCIGNILQNLKESSYYTTTVIISDRLASRAQTFKSADHRWTLTHAFLNFKKKSPVDNVVQSMRFTGQYLPDQPICKVYGTKISHEMMMLSLHKNETTNKWISRLKKQNSSCRLIIPTIPLLTTGYHQKFSLRKGIDDTFVEKTFDDGYAWTYEEALDLATILRNTNGCTGISLVTKRLTISTEKYKRFLNESGRQKELLQFETEKPYSGFDTDLQSRLRDWIIQELPSEIRSEIQHESRRCQLAYTEARQKELDKINHQKGDNYQSRVIALDPKNKKEIPVVIYESSYFRNPVAFVNQVLIWHGIDGRFHILVNIDRQKIRFVKLSY